MLPPARGRRPLSKGDCGTFAKNTSCKWAGKACIAGLERRLSGKTGGMVPQNRSQLAPRQIRRSAEVRGGISQQKGAMAEGVGFEPTDACTSAVFKTAAIDRSATLPHTLQRHRQMLSRRALVTDGGGSIILLAAGQGGAHGSAREYRFKAAAKTTATPTAPDPCWPQAMLNRGRRQRFPYSADASRRPRPPAALPAFCGSLLRG
jgi:hypothetical protein